MKKRIFLFLMILCMLCSLCSCFPTVENNYSTRNLGNAERIRIEQLDLQAKHIKETFSKGFAVDADVIIEIKNSFNTYTAKPFDFDFDHYSRIFAGNEKPVDTFKDDVCEMKYYDKFSTIKESFITNCFVFWSDEYFDRNLGNLYDYYLDKNTAVDYDYYNATLKELDFMSSENARSIAEEKLNAMNLVPYSYTIYSVDYEYLKLYNSFWEEFNRGDTEGMVTYTKDDEFYIVIPRFAMPNGSLLTNIYYAPAEGMSIDSSNVMAFIGKNGILSFNCEGLFDITDEKNTKEIISLNAALDTIKESYKDVSLHSPMTVDRIELSYMPYLTDEKQGIFELKPTWIFRIAKGTDVYSGRLLYLIDATTGIPVLLNETI